MMTNFPLPSCPEVYSILVLFRKVSDIILSFCEEEKIRTTVLCADLNISEYIS